MNTSFLNELIQSFNIIIFSTSCIFSFFIGLYILDGFKFSSIKILKIIQRLLFFTLFLILSPLLLFIILYFFYYLIIVFNDIQMVYFVSDNLNIQSIYSMSDNADSNNNGGFVNALKTIASGIKVNSNVNVTIPTEAAKEIGDKLGNATINFGLGTSIGSGMLAGVKAGTTPTQKLAGAFVGGLGGGAIYVGGAAANRALNMVESTKASNSLNSNGNPPSPTDPTFINSPLELGLTDWIQNSNPVELLLLSIHVLQFLSIISLTYLIIALLSREISKYNYEFTWIDFIFPLSKKKTEKYNINIKIFLRKIIKYFNKSSNINLVIFIFLLFFTNISSYYFMGILVENFEEFSKLYLSLKK